MPSPVSFPTTRWTLILSAGDAGRRREALDWLCQHYWRPIYAFLRRRGQNPTEAQDLTQGFLAAFLQRQSIDGADPARGRFRSYLLGALKHYLADRYAYEQAAMRGGGCEFTSLSFDTVEERYLQTPPSLSPESLYERQWALALVDRVLQLLRAELEAAGKGEQFDQVKGFLTGDGDYGTAAAALRMSEGAVRVAVHRLRRRYRELLTAEIAETVQGPAEVETEIRHLIEVISEG